MRRKNGFTLVELLAVIVILTVIALITTPIILNVINNAKKGASKNSMYGYVEAIELENVKTLVTQENYLTGTYVTKDGDLYLGSEKVLSVSFNGNRPKDGGSVELVQGMVKKAELTFGENLITYENSISNEGGIHSPSPSPTLVPTPTPDYDFSIMSDSSFGSDIVLKKVSTNSAIFDGTGGRSASGSVEVTGQFKANQAYLVTLENISSASGSVSISQTDVTVSTQDSLHVTFVPKQAIAKVTLKISIINPCCGEFLKITIQ